MDEILNLLTSALWFILPAYVANAVPVVLGGGRPIDGGMQFVDGRRIFGAGKTVRGFLAGVAAGTSVGLLQSLFAGALSYYLALGFLIALGALVGDLLGSFIKRRLGIKQGRAAPGLDQLSFVVVALIAASPLALPSWEVVLTIIIITPPIHLATNFGGYKLGLKSRPY
jgi:CDP-2,3-bis-(O-geranylgeranyl)-sn-glycerol synthase